MFVYRVMGAACLSAVVVVVVVVAGPPYRHRTQHFTVTLMQSVAVYRVALYVGAWHAGGSSCVQRLLSLVGRGRRRQGQVEHAYSTLLLPLYDRSIAPFLFRFVFFLSCFFSFLPFWLERSVTLRQPDRGGERALVVGIVPRVFTPTVPSFRIIILVGRALPL